MKKSTYHIFIERVVYTDKDLQKKIGEICKDYRLNILQINLTDFAKLNDENLKNINAFEHGEIFAEHVAMQFDYLKGYGPCILRSHCIWSCALAI